MPATAGRVRMPANNRVHSSRALQTHSIWQSAIGYDPYAPESESKSQPDTNAYSNFQGLLALAKVTTGSSSNGIETRGACKKCGRLGHLSYQCRNFLSFKKEDDNKEIDAFAPEPISKVAVKVESQSSESDSDSDSDSSVDPEIERIIEERYGKKFSDGLRGRSKIRGRHSRRSPSRTRRRKYFDSDSDFDSDYDRKSKRHRRRRAIDSSSNSDSKSNQHRRKKEMDSGSDSDSDYGRRHKRRSHRRRKHRERRSVLSSGSESTDSSSDEERRRRRKHKH